MLAQVALPPPAAPATVPASPFDRRGVNIIALIAHGPAKDLAKLDADATSAGFIARHADGPQGDELMVIFNSANQAAAWAFVLKAERGLYPRLRLERALLPPLVGNR